MSAADWALIALVPTLLLYLGYQWGKATNAKGLEDAQWAVTNAEAEAAAHDAARKVADAAYWREVLEHDKTKAKRMWVGRLAERREGFERTADEIRRLPEAGA